MSSKLLAPPALEPERYDSWRKEMLFWEMATNVEENKRAPTVFLSLTGKAREAVLEMDPNELNAKEGMKKLYAKLDKLFKIDSNLAALMAYEAFEKYVRSEETSATDYLIEIDRLVAKLKDHKIILPEPVLAYRVLKSANLSADLEVLVKATVESLTLDSMSLQLKKVMKSLIASNKSNVAVEIKKEPDVAFATASTSKEEKIEESETREVYYNNNWSHGRHGNRRGRRSGRYNNSYRGGFDRSQNYNEKVTKKSTNPLGYDGKPTTCVVCKSTMHWAKACPHAEKNEEHDVYVANIVLMSENNQSEGPVKTLLGETIGSVILDSGCAKTVCGNVWLDCFIDTLPENRVKAIKVEKGINTFRFGNGGNLTSLKHVILPCTIGGRNVSLNVDVVDSDIPLLLSKAAMKKANTKLDFKNDTVEMFGKKQQLNCTSSGHYYIPLTKKMSVSVKESEVLFIKNLESKTFLEKKKIAEKLHRQFSHPSTGKLTRLVKNARITDSEFLDIVENFSGNCEVCQRYKKPNPKPVVSMSLATDFNEVVAMDIKEVKGFKILHLIDHATRYSVAARLKSKESSEIINVIFRFWITYFGAAKTFFSDNGGEFNNENFRDMAQNLNIIVRNTAAQSPWSNGLNERHNAILGEMILKTMEDTGCDMDVAIAWATSAKNSLHNNNGFSPNQLVFGFNPNLPSVLTNQPPALEGTSTSERVAMNLNAMHAARRSFIENESAEKLRRAYRHQIRDNKLQDYQNGDLVLYKRNESDRWMGPGRVLGLENKQINIKHGGSFVRVHPCRVQKYKSDSCYERENHCEKTNEDTNDQTISNISYDSDEEEAPPGNKNRVNNDTNQKSRSNKQAISVSNNAILPKPGQEILCKMRERQNEDWIKMKVLSHAGKASGKNKNIMNVSKNSDKPFWLDFEKSVSEWKIFEEQIENDFQGFDEVNDENEPESENNLVYVTLPAGVSEEEVEIAKKKELQSWLTNKVYSKVPDLGQSKISTRWIYTKKETENGSIVKARLVARGFQERSEEFIRTDSPTCSKEGFRIALAIMVSNDWSCNSMDVKTAFLQSQSFDRPVYLIPPVEAKVSNVYIWKLAKSVYGLSDASRSWYLTVKNSLLKLGAQVSKHDQAIFTWYDKGVLQGVIASHVDDFCWGGTELFKNKVIEPLKRIFVIKSEETGKFRYLGFDVIKTKDNVKLAQDEYVKDLTTVNYDCHNSFKEKLSDVEETKVRGAIGKINWLANHTRPDLSCDVSILSSTLKERKVDMIKEVNKTIKRAKKEKSQLIIPDLGNLKNLKIIGYSDASFGNLPDCGSQGGQVIFLVGENGNHFPVYWQSKRIRRLVKSTQAAETLAMVDLAEACVYYRSFLLDIFQLKDIPQHIPIVCKSDNSCMYESVHSTTQILDKRLRIEISILKEMLERKDIESIEWVPKENQIADIFTKKGVPSFKILDFLSDPRTPLN